MDPNTRQTKRAPVTLKIKFKSATLDQFIERYAVDVSPGGIFIRTKEPLAVGTQMRFEFQLRDATPLITGDGTVVWTRENDPSRPNAAPGMGVRFDRLGDGSQPILDKILAEKAKQPTAAQVAAEVPKSFMEVPTRVAPSPLMGALAAEGRQPKMGQMAPSRAGFADERTDNTPLPRPMPFHSDADEFPEETFEEATKVRALDDLVAATANPEGDQLGITAPVLRHTPLPQPAVAPPADDNATTAPVPTQRSSQRKIPPPPPHAPPQQVAPVAHDPHEHSGETTPAVVAPTEQVRAPRPPTSPPVPVLLTSPAQAQSTPVRSMPPIATPMPKPAAAAAAEPMVAPTSSRGVSAVVIGLLLAALVAGGVWFFFLREKAKPAPTPPTTSGSTGTASGSTGTGTAAQVVIDAGVEPDAAEVLAETVPITIKANVAGATVEVIETGDRGEAPFDTVLEKGKEFTIRVTAVGMKPVELQVTGGDKSASAKLEAMTKTIHVTSVPAGAAISIDGTSIRKVTPADVVLTRAQAAQPSVRVSLRKPGYAKLGKSFTPSEYEPEGDVLAVTLEANLVRAGGGGGGGGGGSATPAGTGTGSDTGTGTGTGTGSDTGTGTGSAPAGSGTPPAGSGTPPAGSGTPPAGSGSAGSGSAKPAGSGTPPAGSGSATGSGSGKTEPTPDWMK